MDAFILSSSPQRKEHNKVRQLLQMLMHEKSVLTSVILA
jgi:hypothetical protein